MISPLLGAKNPAKLLALFFIVVFLGVMFTSLFHLGGDMTMMTGTSDCPFATHGEVVCAMGVGEHLGAWKSFFTALPQVAFSLLALLALATVFDSCAILFRQLAEVWELSLYSKRAKERHECIAHILTELFSNGILNPKLF